MDRELAAALLSAETTSLKIVLSETVRFGEAVAAMAKTRITPTPMHNTAVLVVRAAAPEALVFTLFLGIL